MKTKLQRMILVPVLAITLVVGWALVNTPQSTSADAGASSEDLVGAWEVQAVGAPYQPHLFTFNDDGTMNTTNPTNVQENASDPHGGTNDSLGMGPWERVRGKHNTYIGTFYQLNATADDHAPADTLAVTYKIVVKGNAFTGNAVAKLGSLSAPATLQGTRLTIDKTAAQGL